MFRREGKKKDFGFGDLKKKKKKKKKGWEKLSEYVYIQWCSGVGGGLVIQRSRVRCSVEVSKMTFLKNILEHDGCVLFYSASKNKEKNPIRFVKLKFYTCEISRFRTLAFASCEML